MKLYTEEQVARKQVIEELEKWVNGRSMDSVSHMVLIEKLSQLKHTK